MIVCLFRRSHPSGLDIDLCHLCDAQITMLAAVRRMTECDRQMIEGEAVRLKREWGPTEWVMHVPPELSNK